MADDDDLLERLRELREEIGTRELAEQLGMPAPSLRRVLSTGRMSERVADAVRDALGESEPYESDDEEVNELAELWGVTPEEAEALRDEIGEDFTGFQGLSHDELRQYIDDLYEQLTEDGWDLDVSDLWDMYYGYTPGGKA